MHSRIKYLVAYVGAVSVITLLSVNLAQAQQPQQIVSVEAVDSETVQAELDQLLAPIALYPDSVLSHVLVASTYPLELVQAARWREQHSDLDEQEALNSVENQNWDPSVKALVPFTDLLNQLVSDLNWLQDLGDVFLADEEMVLARVQELRRRAYENGSLEDNEYVDVVQQDQDIIIQPVNERVIYVPYYDTRVVYGDWWWHDYPPYYWSRPSHYYWHAGLYWSPRVYLRHSLFFSAFTWHNRHVVVNYHHPRRLYDDGVKRVRVTEYQRWTHDPQHRRGVRYDRKVAQRYSHLNTPSRQVVRSVQRQNVSSQHKVVRDGRDPVHKQVNKSKQIKQKMEKSQHKNNLKPNISDKKYSSNNKNKVIRQQNKQTEQPKNRLKSEGKITNKQRNISTSTPKRSKVVQQSTPKSSYSSGQKSVPTRSATEQNRSSKMYKPQHRQTRSVSKRVSSNQRKNKEH